MCPSFFATLFGFCGFVFFFAFLAAFFKMPNTNFLLLILACMVLALYTATVRRIDWLHANVADMDKNLRKIMKKLDIKDDEETSQKKDGPENPST